MLGSLVIGEEAARRQEAEQVTGIHALGPMVVTAEDQARLLARAGLTDVASVVVAEVQAPPADTTLTVQQVRQLLRDNPVMVRDVVAQEAARQSAGLEVRVSVLRVARPVAEAQGLVDLVDAIDQAIDKLLSPGD